MEQELLEKKYISFKKGVEDALRKFTYDIGENVRGMREEISQLKQDIKKKSLLECKKCAEKFINKDTFEQMKAKVDSLGEREENLKDLRNEINDLKIDVSKQNIEETNHVIVAENKINSFEMEIENMRGEKVKNTNEIRMIDERIQALQKENENIRSIIENTKNKKEV